jgi:hypothetical protein
MALFFLGAAAALLSIIIFPLSSSYLVVTISLGILVLFPKLNKIFVNDN